MHRYLAGSLLVVLAASVGFLRPTPGQGCAAVGRKDETIHIAEESAIIVWDAANKVQHFIRRAVFDTDAADFGFLVPTPTKPDLAAASDAAFGLLEKVIAPKTVVVSEFSFKPALCLFGAMTKSDLGKGLPEPQSAVRVLEQKRVGAFDTAILEADEAGALNDWLAKNGYISSPELSWWLGSYVTAKWKITAFKIAHDAKKGGALVGTEAVRMSFKTERPFFPYREPEGAKLPDQKKKAAKDWDKEKGSYSNRRLLRVFFISDARMTGTLGERRWEANVYFADRVEEETRTGLVKTLGVPEGSLVERPWLTTFEDGSSPRLAFDEVYFTPSAEQSTTHPRPNEKIQVTWIPAELVILVIVAILFVLWRWRGRKAEG